MFHFTVHCEKAINERIKSDLSHIRETVTDGLDGVQALILVGGFGRGEGTVRIANEKITPLNDYDVVVVHDRKRMEKLSLTQKIPQLSERLATELDIRFVDLIPKHIDEFSNLEPTKFNVDMKMEHYVFYRDNVDVLNDSDGLSSAEIPDSEVKKLLFNRLICLLESIRHQSSAFEAAEEDNWYTARQASKSILAAADAYLILEGEYVPKYMDKAEACAAIGLDDEFISLVDQAAKVKVDPEAASTIDLVDFWFKSRTTYEQSFWNFVQETYETEFHGWSEYVRHERSNVSIKEWIHSIIHPELLLNTNDPLGNRLRDMVKRDPTTGTEAYLAEILVLFSLDPETKSVNQKLLKQAVEILNAESMTSWETAREAAVDTWYTVNH